MNFTPFPFPTPSRISLYRFLPGVCPHRSQGCLINDLISHAVRSSPRTVFFFLSFSILHNVRRSSLKLIDQQSVIDDAWLFQKVALSLSIPASDDRCPLSIVGGEVIILYRRFIGWFYSSSRLNKDFSTFPAWILYWFLHVMLFFAKRTNARIFGSSRECSIFGIPDLWLNLTTSAIVGVSHCKVIWNSILLSVVSRRYIYVQ